jgi:hypothetical protein
MKDDDAGYVAFIERAFRFHQKRKRLRGTSDSYVCGVEK